ncbi:MAG TPA: AMED_5909 family protein [Pseudonocardiaceae bacterium]|nr:AMED_5909 family protein [Pseudonocardiaceae bacterium]
MRTPEGASHHAQPRTLAEAHHVVASIRPLQKAPLPDWLAYYQRSAAVYAEVAEIDRGHHHEALYMAEHTRQLMNDIKAQISSQRATAGEE